MVRSELDADDYSKGRSKERDRDDERDRDYERSKEKEKLRDREKDRDREDKARDRHRDKERPKDRDKDRGRERDREKDKDRERGKDREYDRDKDYERDRDRDRDYDRGREREHDKDREHRERDYDRDKERDRDRDRFREGSKDLERENERDRNKDKDDKARDGSKHKDREKDDKKKDRGKDRGDGDRARDLDRSREEDNRRDVDPSKERKKEKDKRDRDMENDRDKEKERGREKEREREKGKEREKEKFKDETMEKYKDGRGKEKDLEFEKKEDQDKVVNMEVDALEAGEIQESKKGASEISAWVNKSRILEEKRKIEERNKAEWMAKLLSDQDNAGDSEDEENPGYSAKDLAGLKVLHGIDKVMDGGAVVLTLKDKNILEGDDVNEDADELENIEIAQQRARDEAYKAAKKKPGTYEDKFQNDINAHREILPQYDEVMKDEGMELNDSGGLSEEGLRMLEELKKKLQGIGEKPYEVLPTGVTVASEFYTQEEMLQLNKPKKKKKLRKKTGLDLNALEAEAKAEGLDDIDHGSRMLDERKNVKLEKEKAEEELRRSAYLNAYAKAVDASQKLKAASIPETRDDDAVVVGGEEDDELERFLQRSRQAALKKQVENGSVSVGPQAVVTALQQSTVENMEIVLAEDNAEKDKGTVVISDMEEFCRSLQLDEILMRRPAVKDAFGEDDEPAVEEKISTTDGAWAEVNEVHEDEDMEEQKEEGDNQNEEVISEVSIGKGLAGALQLLKERGTLKETVDWGGRDMDKKKSKLVGIVDKEQKFQNREIILDRVDEFGRTMTPKEAFRKLSHKFHGKGPGKMKLEKKMKQHEKEQKLKQMSAGDTPSLSMEKMREVQAKMHTPYIVISGHIKPGQTSDPRSGFATVEKESVGSLTPMLGDKKVEHFLGIKRRPEDGSMKPPLPKKPKQ